MPEIYWFGVHQLQQNSFDLVTSTDHFSLVESKWKTLFAQH